MIKEGRADKGKSEASALESASVASANPNQEIDTSDNREKEKEVIVTLIKMTFKWMMIYLNILLRCKRPLLIAL